MLRFKNTPTQIIVFWKDQYNRLAVIDKKDKTFLLYDHFIFTKTELLEIVAKMEELNTKN